MTFRQMKQFMSAMVSQALAGDKDGMKDTMDMAKASSGSLGVIVMSVMSLVVGSTFLYIGIFVNAVVYNAIPTGSLTAADNTTLSGIKTNVNTAFTLAGIILIVVGAAGIISVLLGMAGGSRGTA